MARIRKAKNLDKQLERWGAAIVDDPRAIKGRWRETFLPDAREVHLDLGCGKGGFLVESARRNPDVLYVGVDFDEICIARCAEKVVEGNVAGVKLVIENAHHVLGMFAPGELSVIHLNFNAPYPSKKYAGERLTHLDFLNDYRTLLAPNGAIEVRTDHMPYWKFTLEELRIAGYEIEWQTEDLHAQSWAKDFIRSEYDERLVAKGAVVYALRAHPGPMPAAMEQTEHLSLVDYLPDDLETLERIPYGMEDTITNMRNRRRNAAEAVARKAWWEQHYGMAHSKKPSQKRSAHN